MAFQWVQTDPNGLQAPTGYSQAPTGYSYNYPRSAQTSPYAQPGLLPTPPVAVSPLPNGPVWLPVYSPGNQAVPLPSPGAKPMNLSSHPVLIDILHQNSRRSGAKQPHLIYDLRDYPEKSLVNTRPQPVPLSDAHLDAPITSPPTTQIKVISKAFPWEIDVESASNTVPVTVGDLISAVHGMLRNSLNNEASESNSCFHVFRVSSETHHRFRVVDCDRSSTRKVRCCCKLLSPPHLQPTLISSPESAPSMLRTATARRRVILAGMKSRNRARSPKASEGTFIHSFVFRPLAIGSCIELNVGLIGYSIMPL